MLQKHSEEEVLEGASHIITAEIVANTDLRSDLIDTLQQHGNIQSKVRSDKMLEKLNEKDRAQVQKFDIYKDFSCRISRIKPYQILALNRGKKLGILNTKLEKTDRTEE